MRTEVPCGYCGRRLTKVKHLCYCEGLSWYQLLAFKIRPAKTKIVFKIRLVKIKIKKAFVRVKTNALEQLSGPGVKLGIIIASILAAIVFGGGIGYLQFLEGIKRGF